MKPSRTQKLDRDSFVLRVIIVGLVGLVVSLALLLFAQGHPPMPQGINRRLRPIRHSKLA